MPSPVAHFLAGLTVHVATAPASDVGWRRRTAITVAAAIAPDLDLLLKPLGLAVHQGASHSVGAALVAGAIAWIATRRPRWGLTVTLTWASHILLDWMSNDTRPPMGVMALWPLTHDYYKSSIELLPAVSRRYWLAEFWVYNLKAVAVELVILGPIAAFVVWLRLRGKAQ